MIDYVKNDNSQRFDERRDERPASAVARCALRARAFAVNVTHSDDSDCLW
jgi:hypothetical protein